MNVLEFDGVKVLYQPSPVFVLAAKEMRETVTETKTEDVKMEEAPEPMPAEEGVNSEKIEKTPEILEKPTMKEDKEAVDGSENEAEGEAMPEGEAIPEGEAMPMIGGDAEMGKDGMNIDGMGMEGMMGMEPKPTLMQKPVALAGITAGVLTLGILLGIGLAKLKIKKGINLYED